MADNNAISMLKAMMAGVPTKETEALRLKNEIYSNGSHHDYDPRQLQEMTQNSNLPSANDLNISNRDIMMSSSNQQALPPVSADDIMALMTKGVGAARQQQQQNPQPQQPQYQQPQYQQQFHQPQQQRPLNEQYPMAPVSDFVDPFVASDGERNYTFDTRAELEKRLALKAARPVMNESMMAPRATTNTGPIDMNVLEDMVWKVLGQICEQAYESSKDKQIIKMKIGEHLFVGTLQKAVAKAKAK